MIDGINSALIQNHSTAGASHHKGNAAKPSRPAFDLHAAIRSSDQDNPQPQPRPARAAHPPTAPSHTVDQAANQSTKKDHLPSATNTDRGDPKAEDPAGNPKDPRTQPADPSDPITTLLARAKYTSLQLLQVRQTAGSRKLSNDAAVTQEADASTHQPLPLIFASPLPQPPGNVSDKPLGTASQGGAAAATATDQVNPQTAKPTPGSLAFSATIRPREESATETLPVLEKKASESTRDFEPEAEAAQLPLSPAGTSVILNESRHTSAAATPAGSSEKSEGPSVTSLQAAEPVVETKSTEPLRDIVLHVPGSQGVEVRISDRGGELKVDVRSGDQALNQDLRVNLHELVSNLDRKGFSTHISHVVTETVTSAAAASDTGLSQDGRQGGNRGQAGEQEQQQQHRHPDERHGGNSAKARDAAWAEVFQTNSK